VVGLAVNEIANGSDLWSLRISLVYFAIMLVYVHESFGVCRGWPVDASASTTFRIGLTGKS
jgi:hypothetical protein